MRQGRMVLSFALLATIVATAGACYRGKGPSTDASTPDTPTVRFVGYVREVRGAVVIVEEQATNNNRRGEIWTTPSTEIITHSGMLLPVANIKRGMRVQVWFRGKVQEASGVLSATAARMIVDY